MTEDKRLHTCMLFLENSIRTKNYVDITSLEDYKKLSNESKKFLDHLIHNTQRSILPESYDFTLINL